MALLPSPCPLAQTHCCRQMAAFCLFQRSFPCHCGQALAPDWNCWVSDNSHKESRLLTVGVGALSLYKGHSTVDRVFLRTQLTHDRRVRVQCVNTFTFTVKSFATRCVCSLMCAFCVPTQGEAGKAGNSGEVGFPGSAVSPSTSFTHSNCTNCVAAEEVLLPLVHESSVDNKNVDLSHFFCRVPEDFLGLPGLLDSRVTE